MGFFDNNRLIGIGEVYTLDEIHGCMPSYKLETPWITPYHKLLHIADTEEHIKFTIIVVGAWKLPPWRDAKRSLWKNGLIVGSIL